MLPGLWGIDISSELDRVLERKYKMVTPSPVVRELKRLSKSGTPAERSAARLGLTPLMYGEVVKVKGPADAAILRLAGKGNCAVGTIDATLRRKLRQRGVPVIYLRQKSHLAVDGRIG